MTSATAPHQKSKIVRDLDFYHDGVYDYEEVVTARMSSIADSMKRTKEEVAAHVMSNAGSGSHSLLWKGVNAWYSKNCPSEQDAAADELESERIEACMTRLVDTVRKTMSPEEYQTASDDLITTVTEKMVAHKRCTNTLLNRMAQPSAKRKATGEALTLAKSIQRDTDLLTAVMINIENSNS